MIIDVNFKVDLKRGVMPQVLSQPLYFQEQNAHRINVTIMDGTSAVQIDPSAQCRGYFTVLNLEETLGPIEGTVSNNVCSVVLPQGVYAATGPFRFTINLVENDSATTVLALTGNVYSTKSDTVIDITGSIVPSLEELITKINAVDGIGSFLAVTRVMPSHDAGVGTRGKWSLDDGIATFVASPSSGSYYAFDAFPVNVGETYVGAVRYANANTHQIMLVSETATEGEYSLVEDIRPETYSSAVDFYFHFVIQEGVTHILFTRYGVSTYYIERLDPVDLVHTIYQVSTTLNAQDRCDYIYNASISSLIVNAPAVGSFSVRFQTGTSTPAITLNGITMPDYWTGFQTNHIYELNVRDGLGVIAWWPITI